MEIQYLSRLFDNTSECYKFFWFQAIVTKVLEGKTVLTYEELIDGMIADAWLPGYDMWKGNVQYGY